MKNTRLGFLLSQVPKREAVKCRDMVYILSPGILYTFPRRDDDQASRRSGGFDNECATAQSHDLTA
jgi:hypothetical protein